jgi:hypothetical protein
MNSPPSLIIRATKVQLSGIWTLAAMLPLLPALQQQLSDAASLADAWDLTAVERIDSAAAVLLWRCWGERWPDSLLLSPLQRQVLAPRGLTFSGLTPREAEVVRLVADGLDTREIALRMSRYQTRCARVCRTSTSQRSPGLFNRASRFRPPRRAASSIRLRHFSTTS